MTEGVTLCPHCQQDNPEGARFCSACGAKLEAVCPKCGQGNPPGSRFCNECGLDVEEAPSKGQHQEPERRDTPQTIASKRKLRRGLVALYGFVLAGVLLCAVMGVYDFLTRFAACNAARDAKRMGQLNGLVGAEPIPAAIDADQLADGIAELMRVPLWVIRTDSIGVADSHALYVGFP